MSFAGYVLGILFIAGLVGALFPKAMAKIFRGYAALRSPWTDPDDIPFQLGTIRWLSVILIGVVLVIAIAVFVLK